MDRDLLKVGEILRLAESNSVTDRRKFLEQLNNIYANDESIEAINIQTAKDFHSATSWNQIMLTIHRSALSEAEKPLGKNTSSKTTALAQSGFSRLMCKTLSLATNTADISLSCDDLMAISFQVLGNKIYQAYHDTYINILLNHVLTNEMYLVKITAEQWREILRLSMKIYIETSNKSVLLDTMRLVVQHGCSQSHLSLEVMKILPFLEKVYQDIGPGKEFILKPLYKLTYTVCLQIGTESRIALCEFSEKSLAPIICFEGCSEMYKMLLLFVQIHHPGGVSIDAASPQDSNQWKYIIRGIHGNIIRNIKSEKLETCFLKLCCEVFRRIFQDTSYLAETASNRTITQDEPHPRKIRRLTESFERPIDMLLKNDLRHIWPFIQILTVLLRKYPDTLKSSDYPAFLKKVTEHVGVSLDSETILGSLCELSTVLVKHEKEYYKENEEIESVKVCWQQIWETVLRASSMNKNEVPCHELLQSIIQSRKVMNPHAFLRLYDKRSICWSSSSVETLLKFWTHVSISSIESSDPGNFAFAKPQFSIRSSLLEWALDIPSTKFSTEIPVVSLAKLLTCLAIKSSRNREFRSSENDDSESLESELLDNWESKVTNEIERCNLTLMFQHDPFVDVEETKKGETNVPRGTHEIIENIFDDLVDSLVDSLANPQNEKNEINMRITKAIVAAKILSNFAELNVGFESKKMSRLVRAFREAYENILSEFMTNTLTASSHQSYSEKSAEPIEALERLYRTRYHSKVEKIINQLTSIEFIQHVSNLVPIEYSEKCKIDNSRGRKTGKPSATFRARTSAENIVTHYCCAQIGGEITESQISLLKNFIKMMDTCQCTARNGGCIRRALKLLSALGSSDQPSRSSDFLEVTIEFVTQLLKMRGEDERVVRGVLKVIPHLIKAAEASLSIRGIDPVVNILSRINKALAKENYGPLVHAEFLKCLAELIRLNPLIKWQISRVIQSPQPIIEHLITYIKSPFYVVRLQAVRAFYAAFSSKQVDARWMLDFFEKSVTAVADLLASNDLSPTVDDLTTRKITAVLFFAAVIRGTDSRQLRSRALLAIVELSVKRDIEATTIKQALLLSRPKNDRSSESWSRRLVEMNLHKLLSHCLETGPSLERFPWILADCDSLEDFLRRYIETVVTIKLQRREFKQLEIFCRNLEVSFARTIEDCFAPIMSLLTLMKIQHSSNRTDESVAIYASEIHERLRKNIAEFASVKNFSDLLDEKLPHVVVDIVKRLHDQCHFNTMFKTDVTLSSSENEPSFNRETVEQCFRSLETDLSLKKDSFIEHLVTRRPNVLQKVLLTLVSNIYDVKFTNYEPQAFYRYAYFYSSVIDNLSKSYFDPMSLYVVRDVAHSLLDFIKDETLLSDMACEYFEKFLCAALPTRANEIKEILSFVVSTLMPICQSGKVKGAVNLLRYTIVEHRQVLDESIAKLDSFPNEEAFQEIKQVHNALKYGKNKIYSLENEIESFLNAINEKTLCCSLEGLSHLNNQLSTRKNELRELYGKLEKLRGFAEDCASSTLHRLIYMLVQLSGSSDDDISLEAAKCLGELGPADLTTIILHPEKGYDKERQRDNDTRGSIEKFTINVMNHLSEYVVDSNIDLRKASANALHTVFSSGWAWKFTDKTYLNETIALLYGIENSTLYDSIYPFVSSSQKKSKSVQIRIDVNGLDILINRSNDLWVPNNYDDYSKWIIEITSRLLDCFLNFYAEGLKPVCQRSVEFSEMLLPRLVNLLISTKASLVNQLCSCVNRFFSCLFESIRDADDSVLIATPDSTIQNSRNDKDVSRSHECVRSMLSVVNFMRIHSIDNNVPLSLDYLFIASAADYSSAYFSSLLYAELSCQALLQDSENNHVKVPGSWISAIDYVCELNPRSGRLLQHIVREAYLHIGDPDSIYGCGLSHLIDSSFRAQHYTHLRQWDKVILEQDMELNCSTSASRRDMLNALQQSGHHYLLGLVVNSPNMEADNVDDFMYEAAWRLADWSALESPRVTDSIEHSSATSDKSHDYHASHYRALECLRDGNVVALTNALNNARTSIVKSLRKTTLECSQTIYPILSKLRMLREVEEFTAAMSEPDRYNKKLVAEWNQEDFSNTHDFQYVEQILSQRLALYEIQKCRSTVAASDIDLSVIHTHLKIAQVAEKQGYLSMASRALDTLAEKIDLSDAAKDKLIYQKALLAWKEDEGNISRYLLRDLIKKPALDASLRAKALRICGNWMAETKCEKPQAIIKNYYEKSITTSLELEAPSSCDTKTLMDAQADLGQFADAQYQQIVRYTKSAQYENLMKCSKTDDTDQATMSNTVSFENNDETEAIITYRQQVTEDASELEDIIKEKEMYLLLAVNNYLQTLENSNDHDLLVFRLVSLWLDNPFHEELNKILEGGLPRIASHKFITLLCQVAPHMSNVENDFTVKINNLMERCAMEHPHHTLPVLFALKNTYKDEEFQPSERSSQKNSKSRPEPRILATSALLSKLIYSDIRPIIQEISQLSHALVMLAYYKVPPAQAKKIGVPHSIPRNQAIMRIRNFNHTIVPTITLNVSPSGNYDNIVGILEYETKFELPGGVNAPKNIICIGTDGIQRRQLVKGQDDLRQDAVMQQVCTVMNTMLKASRETKRRRLHIRTYKIVPLSRRSGILEWCQNTLPISHVLTDIGKKPGMHTKYYPNDWSVSTCRAKLHAVKDEPRNVKLAAFLECCKNLHPAFHYFFMEKYPSAEMWFERRIAYTRSVATTSMIGYMLGLGDRHFSNILIDQTTAEVIHIDFGIAFAQGKVLPVPETVPFRLTRDMEVAMGICGVEGVMKRSCEETIAVLRDRRKTLITVLQVLLYDPLFSWAITPVKTNELERSNSRFTRGSTEEQDKKNTNEIAEKALLRIDEKLQGTTDGVTLSISGQVERLIQQARDPANLCRLFCGWQPYL